MKNKLFFSGLIGMMLIVGISIISCGDEEESFSSKTDNSVANDVAALGLIGTSTVSGDPKIVTAEITDGKIAITSKGAGKTTVRVIKDDNTSEAVISVTVSSDGTITIDTVLKGGDPVMRIGGTIAITWGNLQPGTVSVGIYGENVSGQLGSAEVDGSGHWQIKTAPLQQQTALNFEIYINFSDSEGLIYVISREAAQVSVGNTGKTDIVLSPIDLSSLITLSGTASASLAGTWNVVTKSLRVLVNSGQGWVGWTKVSGANWSIRVPSSDTPVSVSFSIRYQNEDEWEIGQKNNLMPQEITNQNISNIALGTVPFVLLSGTTPVTVNGATPLMAIVDFGSYGGENNGWTAETKVFDSQGRWAIPVPANIKLDAVILYKKTSHAEQWKSSGWLEIPDTGSVAKTIDLSGIATITE
jgi:hypothetical protein